MMPKLLDLVLFPILVYISRAQACSIASISQCISYDPYAWYFNNCPCIACNSSLSLVPSVGGFSCCLSSISFCLNCNLSFQCTQCTCGYGFNSSLVCVPCTVNHCCVCNSYTICIECLAGFSINSNNTCISCNTICPYCSDCTNLTDCYYCVVGFGLYSSTSCLPCNTTIANCKYCRFTDNCNQCLNTSYLLLSNGSCPPCSQVLDFCATCSSYLGYAWCASCLNNSYCLFSSNCILCNASIQGCQLCSNFFTCTQCINTSYLLIGSQCYYCSSVLNFCLTCSSQSQCLTCINNSYTIWSNYCYLCNFFLQWCQLCSSYQICSECSSGFLLMANSTCQSCSLIISNCFTCTSLTQCDSCISQEFYLLSNSCYLCNTSLVGCTLCSSNLNCVLCNDFYALVNDTCQLCYLAIDFCLTCSSSSTVCTSCINRFYYLDTVCYLCGTSLANCMTCTSKTTCIQCVDHSYVIVNSSCQLCSIAVGPSCVRCLSPTTCDSCLTNQYILQPITTFPYGYACQLCTKIMKGCITCDNTSCISCGKGLPVGFGCSQVNGCIKVNPLLDVSSNCIRCNTDLYFQTPVNNACVCKEGWIIGNLCGNIIGCTGLKLKNSSTTVCISCQQSKGFLLVQGTCICKPYYGILGSACTEICGDGYLFVLPCDDGNLINGDGCSSSCQIEQSYVCKILSSFPASQCLFKSKVTLSLSTIAQVPNSNSVQITFDINPYASSITKMNFSSFTNFTANFCQLKSFSVVNQQLIFQVSLNTTATDPAANIFIQFDPTYILSPNFTLSFNLTPTDGGELQFYPNIERIDRSLIKIIEIESLLSLGAFVVGSFAYKMIGVENIHTFQIILLLVVNSRSYSSIFFQMSNTSISYGQLYQLFSQDNHLPIKQQMFARLQYTSRPLQNYQILLAIQMIVAVIYITVRIYCQWIKDKIIPSKNQENSMQIVDSERGQNNLQEEKRRYIKANKQIDNIEDLSICIQRSRQQDKSIQFLIQRLKMVKKAAACIYDWMMFPFFIGFMFHFINSLLMNQMFSSTGIPSLLDQITADLVIVIALGKFSVFGNEFKALFFIKFLRKDRLLKLNCLYSYIPLYLMSSVLLFAVITMGLFKIITYEYEISAVIIVLNLAYVCLKRPYMRSVHNVAIFMNQAALGFIIGWLLFEQYSVISYSTEKLMFYGLIGVLGVVLSLSLLRTVLAIWEQYFQKIEAEQLKEGKAQKPINVHQKIQNLLLPSNTAKFKQKDKCLQNQFMARGRQHVNFELDNPLNISLKQKKYINKVGKISNIQEVQGMILGQQNRADFSNRLIDK